mgnify:FL=1
MGKAQFSDVAQGQGCTEQVASTAKPTSFFQRLSFRMGVGVILFVVLVMVANYYVAQTRGREVVAEQTNKLNDNVGQSLVLKLNERLVSAESLTTALANLALVLPKETDMFHKLIPHLIDNAGMKKLIAGGGIWPEPNRFKEGVERNSFFWGRNEQGVLKFYDDYNDPEGNGYHQEEWYVPARFMEKGRVYWSKSYMDPYSQEPMVTCTVPMWSEAGFEGVATIDLKLAGLSAFMAEQAKLLGGYAFAVDRNNRLLSFPRIKEDYFVEVSQEDFPTLEVLAQKHSGFGPVAKILTDIDEQYLKAVNNSKSANLLSLTRRIDAGSYQIETQEASMVAAMLLGENYSSNKGEYFLLDTDPILNEPVSVRVLSMINTGWKLVVSMPVKYTDAVVSEITERMLSLLFVLLTLMTIIYMLFFKAAFLLPVNKLTHQVRKLVSREDYVTKLDLHGADELSQLASWFNIRTSQLSDVLEKLKMKNIALDEARLESEQANRAKNIFLASMSHDIRTPMNAIIGMSDVLGKSELGLEQSNYARVINSSAQALLSLINDIMDFSKIEANQLDLENIPFNLRETLDDCADLIAFQAAEKNLEFIYFLSPEVNPNVIGDPSRIRQIILNLAGNALKFTSAGRVELWVEPTHQSTDAVNLHIEVRDTGIGLSQSAQENLFMPFSQGDVTTTRKYGGTGLGLTISKHLAGLMGGNIEFRSVENIGTTFTFNIKLAAQHGVGAGSLEANAHQEKQNLFVLGQNHFQNAVIERYAEASAFECYIFSTLQAWLDALEICEPDKCISLCIDQGLLGDLDDLNKRIPSKLDQHRMIILKAQNDQFWEDLKALVPSLNILPLTLPLKFDALKAKFRPNKPKEKIKTVENASLEPFNHKRLLVVEDNKVNQQVIMIMLRHLGLNADVANDGVEAVEAVQKKDYDLVLMDWQMPRMDGLEATRRIRASRSDSKPIIIAVTANAMSGDLDKCMEAGMDDYLSKPIRRDKIELTLRKWLLGES